MNDDLLADLLAAVDQQIASPRTPYVAETLARLLAGGLDEAEARSRIALRLGEEMDRVMTAGRGFDESAYMAALADLPLAEDG